jgi:hypothetical protein
LRNNFAAARTCTGTKIDNVIRSPYRFFVVLDHNDGIAQVAKTAERPQQPCIVALMQPNAWFIQNVKDSR